MHSKKFKVIAALALTGVMVADLAQARDNAELNWSVTIGTPYVTPYYGPPSPVYVRPAPVVRQQPYPVYQQPYPVYQQPYPVYQQPYPIYQQPTRWDRDGDGVPNRYDRVYNPRWDRDGDGIPNRHDHHYDARHARDGDRVANWQDRPDARSSGNWGR